MGNTADNRERRVRHRAIKRLDRARRRSADSGVDHLRRFLLVAALATLLLFVYLLANLQK